MNARSVSSQIACYFSSSWVIHSPLLRPVHGAIGNKIFNFEIKLRPDRSYFCRSTKTKVVISSITAMAYSLNVFIGKRPYGKSQDLQSLLEPKTWLVLSL